MENLDSPSVEELDSKRGGGLDVKLTRLVPKWDGFKRCQIITSGKSNQYTASLPMIEELILVKRINFSKENQLGLVSMDRADIRTLSDESIYVIPP
mmetsp:Transcript_3305/g.6214  ORF Transcript_3305/g.6214 Transcript_3305/m.6214 type:complete len:96 (+) Transcript_3305:913-1200(+)